MKAQIAGDDDRTCVLYSARMAQSEPGSVSLADPSSGERVLTPVRGRQCDHLEVCSRPLSFLRFGCSPALFAQAFDLLSFLDANKDGDGRCPFSDCRKPCPPPAGLSLCHWLLAALVNDPYVRSQMCSRAAR